MTRRRSFWSWLVNAPPDPTPTRLTEAEAVSLANGSPQVAALGRALPMARAFEDVDGRMTWRVASAGVGAQWWVEIDDTTGTVSEVHHMVER